jgi:hypothetical protein
MRWHVDRCLLFTSRQGTPDAWHGKTWATLPDMKLKLQSYWS